MSFLGSVPSNLGRISLHKTKHGFETRRTWRDLQTGEERICVVPLGREQAREWYEACEERGICRVKAAREAFGWQKRRALA